MVDHPSRTRRRSWGVPEESVVPGLLSRVTISRILQPEKARLPGLTCRWLTGQGLTHDGGLILV